MKKSSPSKKKQKTGKPPSHLFLPVDTIDVNDGNHFTEANNQKGNGTGKVVKQSEPVVSRACGKNESQSKGYQTGQPWKILQLHQLSSNVLIIKKKFQNIFYFVFVFLYFCKTF